MIGLITRALQADVSSKNGPLIVKYKKIFFSETNGQNSTKLYRNDPQDMFFQIPSLNSDRVDNMGDRAFHVTRKWALNGEILKQSSSLKLPVRIQAYFT